MNLTLVVGSGRCGSTLLSRLLRDHPDVLSVGELFTVLTAHQQDLPLGEMDGEAVWSLLTTPNPAMDALAAAGLAPPEMAYPYRTGRHRPETGVPVIAHAVLPSLTDDPDALLDSLAPVVRAWPTRPAAAHYRALLEHLAALFGRDTIVERSAASLHLVPTLHAAFPDARIVHMHRDGPDCALSMSRHAGFRMIALAQRAMQLGDVTLTPKLTSAHLEAIPPDALSLLIPPMDAAAFMSYPIPLPVFGALWSSMIVDGVAALDMLPATATSTLRYEDLLHSPEATLTRLAATLGAPVDGDWLARSRALITPATTGRSRTLPPAELAALEAACRPGMKALGLID
ncbi:hypothetical protein J2S43_003297 [Catenuloplanes nepalensis]|uniref:Sulfotransferase n=1 Tax=Catenuloplanes nepalensis TaxID=587533 RepID=A0ABT9MTM1_9ACTN|nr:sulfotransferase [Catenuloplanes nepalensis]MDP9794785.1 hypothetical protein [Catenuloplanes nepalensis]